ncbi:general secretion pathway protein GspK [Mesorhizobium sp. AD1-1]|uniref:general secretion pathway protein GspK n=1 Tax=Mesorhizobium sp. AD1-1 TaxID=2876621 RepID=UPI001CCCA951|nr:general secretion pathway protein GspK [Mesorhizobium sp. AD1-1]MBZ9722299.1 general secretion pathway protein GspK [Mesorhizobium sp. AD1-1]
MVEENPRDSSASCECQSAGFALVAVLVFLLIVSAITSTFALTAWTRLKIASNETESQRFGLLAEGLTNVLAARLSSAGPDIGLPLNFEPVSCVVGNLTVVTRLQGHSGLIDLNAADHTLLVQGFASLGVDPEMSNWLAIAVEYSRSGASIFAAVATQKVEVVGGFKHAPFESVAELQDFSRLRSISLPDLYSTFTVNSRRGDLVVSRAGPTLANFVKAGTSAGAKIPEQAFTIEVSVSRRGSAIVGSAGYVFESRSGDQASLLRTAAVLGTIGAKTRGVPHPRR